MMKIKILILTITALLLTACGGDDKKPPIPRPSPQPTADPMPTVAPTPIPEPSVAPTVVPTPAPATSRPTPYATPAINPQDYYPQRTTILAVALMLLLLLGSVRRFAWK